MEAPRKRGRKGGRAEVEIQPETKALKLAAVGTGPESWGNQCVSTSTTRNTRSTFQCNLGQLNAGVQKTWHSSPLLTISLWQFPCGVGQLNSVALRSVPPTSSPQRKQYCCPAPKFQWGLVAHMHEGRFGLGPGSRCDVNSVWIPR